jgi:transcriptional regulator with XRE-family HTH domain
MERAAKTKPPILPRDGSRQISRPLRETLGANLFELRKSKTKEGGRVWAKQDVAAAAGLSLVAYDRIERVKAACSVDTIEKLARAFNVSPASLLR